MRLRILSVPLALLLGVALAPSAGAQSAPRSIYLDSYDKGRDAVIGPVRSARLTRDKPYVADVRGTFSYFNVRADAVNCGAAERRPIYRSPRARNGAVVADAVFVFGERLRRCTKPDGQPAIPAPSIKFEIAVRNKYKDYAPIGLPAVPTANHAYGFALIGKGRAARFRLRDTDTWDNYGRLRIRVRAAIAADCAGLGYTLWGYADEASCASATLLR